MEKLNKAKQIIHLLQQGTSKLTTRTKYLVIGPNSAYLQNKKTEVAVI
jgi:hypothetical protein